MYIQAHTEESGLPTYTNADFNGRYALKVTGTVGDAPLVEVGVLIADGKGKVSGESTFIIGGIITSTSFNGNYTLAANGIGTMSFVDPTFNYEVIFVLGEGNKHLSFITTKVQNSSTGEELTPVHVIATGIKQ